MTDQNLNLIWIDLEMTGLDPEKERIIEIATVVTDSELNVLAEGPSLAINQSEQLLQAMDEWNTNQHGKSGLTERVRNSQITESEAAKATIDFLKPVSYTHLRAHETKANLVCRLLLEKKNKR